MKKIAITLISYYQKYLSPDHSIWSKALEKPPYCRHVPSCSEYTKQSIREFGFVRGGWEGCKRVSRCMPWNKPSYDPVKKDDK